MVKIEIYFWSHRKSMFARRWVTGDGRRTTGDLFVVFHIWEINLNTDEIYGVHLKLKLLASFRFSLLCWLLFLARFTLKFNAFSCVPIGRYSSAPEARLRIWSKVYAVGTRVWQSIKSHIFSGRLFKRWFICMKTTVCIATSKATTFCWRNRAMWSWWILVWAHTWRPQWPDATPV